MDPDGFQEGSIISWSEYLIFDRDFSMMLQNATFFVGFPARGALGGLKLDEIDATSSFLMLPMARNGLKWPVKTSQISV